MTGTERAALRLALGWVRESVGFFHVRRGGPVHRENRCIDEVDRLREFFGQCSGDPALIGSAVLTGQAYQTPPRLIRARLALYIRAVVRADDWHGYVEHAEKHGGAWMTWYGPSDRHHEAPCSTCHGTGWAYGETCDWCGGTPFVAPPMPRPLWLDAPGHRP